MWRDNPSESQLIEFHDWKSWKWWYDWSMNTKLDILTCTANSWSWRWHGYACIYIYIWQNVKTKHDWSSIKCSSAPTHTHKFNNLPPHTEVGKRIIKREKWNFFTLAEQYMIYSTSIHFKSGVIWVSKQRSPSHAPHPQPQVESWQVISHAPTVMLQSATYSAQLLYARIDRFPFWRKVVKRQSTSDVWVSSPH